MTARSKLFGGDALVKKLKGVSQGARGPIIQALAKVAIDTATEAKILIQRGVKTGIVYSQTSPRRTHKASAPGEAPATDTGRLVASIHHTVDERDLSSEALSDVEYAPFLELGTRHIAKRPFFMPAFAMMKKKNVKTFARIVGRAVERAAGK